MTGPLLPDPPEPSQRLWTPWRMRYVGGEARVDGCLFCNQVAGADDVASLVLWRGPRVFVTMNLFPYNTGHVMVVPNAHVATPEETDPATLSEMATLLRPMLAASRRALACAGFNIGMNVGDVAGAGIAAHLHQHVVPRWTGDANFMPIIAGTMVLPEMIPVTYAKLRAEFARELDDAPDIVVAAVGADGTSLLVDAAGRLPTVAAVSGQSLARTATDAAAALTGSVPQLVGWAGGRRADDGPRALAFRSDADDSSPVADGRWAQVDALADDQDRWIATTALAAAADAVVAPG